jgi:Zn-dependent protease with chaperone function
MEPGTDVSSLAAPRLRKLRAWRAGIIAVELTALAALLVLVIVPFAAGSDSFSPLVKKTGGTAALTGGLFAVGLLVLLAALYVPGLLRSRRYFRGLTARARKFDARSLGRVLNALEGVAGDAGVKAPFVAVLDGDAPNALAFEGRGGPVVGITDAALEADITYEELQAVMAHELASVMCGDILRQPGSFKFVGVAYVLVSAVAALGLMSLAIIRLSDSGALTFAVAAAIFAVVTVVGFMIRRLRELGGHDYLLADSIGAAITGRPNSMAGAIERMDHLVNGRKKMPYPDSELGLDYLFVQPYRWSETPLQYLQRRARELDYDLARRNVDKRVSSLQESMDELARRGQSLLATRLQKLKDT